jgi:hypothetical protein
MKHQHLAAVLEARAAVILRRRVQGVNRRSHGTVEHENAFLQRRAQGGNPGFIRGHFRPVVTDGLGDFYARKTIVPRQPAPFRATFGGGHNRRAPHTDPFAAVTKEATPRARLRSQYTASVYGAVGQRRKQK